MPEREIGISGINVQPGRLRALRPDVVAQLAESIRARGLINAITVRPRGEHGYWLIAGLHRFEAVRQLKHEAIRSVVLEGLEAADAELLEIDENLIRADLSPAERALHIGRRKELYEAQHPETKQGGAPGAGQGKGKSYKEANLASFQEDTANKTQQSTRKVRRDATRAKTVAVLADITGTCLDKGDEIDALAKLSDEEQRGLAKAAKEGSKVSAKTRVKQIKRSDREKELAVKQIALPTKKFGVIVADPEWRFEPWSRSTGMDRAADNHYPTSCTEVIAARDVPSIAADECVLFLWATAPMMLHAAAVMDAWGFTYKTHCVWRKPRAITGYWFRFAHELLLVGTKGNIPAPAMGTQSESVLDAPSPGPHSSKPELFLEEIERLFPTLPKIELNRRGPARPGWAAWGNELAFRVPADAETIAHENGTRPEVCRHSFTHEEFPDLPEFLRRGPDGLAPWQRDRAKMQSPAVPGSRRVIS